jgi:(p)ppGpp synthase/HD superfamily hydrolase
MINECLLDRAFQLAILAHESQVDKSGQAYIAHVARVWFNLQSNGEDLETQVLGLLHDVVEDSDFTFDYIQRYLEVDDSFSEDLKLLTKESGVTYQEYIDRLCSSKRAARVKAADIEDHFRDDRYLSESLKQRYQKAYDKVATKAWSNES